MYIKTALPVAKKETLLNMELKITDRQQQEVKKDLTKEGLPAHPKPQPL